ncbi:MAG TPA: DsbA family protein [Patescibacteria group bacterium]|nr:DsbA family protein [Patescibacteria group bacterium]
MPKINSDNQEPKNENFLALSIGIALVSLFFVGSLYTRVKFLEKELGTYKNGSQVEGIQVEAKGNDTNPTQPSQPSAVAPELKGEIKLTTDDHVNGEKDARIFLFEYSDMECPYCKRFHPTAQKIVDSYKGDVAWVYRHLPLPFHANAAKEAEASECANELGGNTAFWKFVNVLFTKTNSGGTGIALSDLPDLAKEAGVNESKFTSCLESGKYADRVKSDADTAASLGVNGTPGNILLDTKTGKTKLMPGAYPYEDFKKAIDQMLEN